jgi:hypothetical protein
MQASPQGGCQDGPLLDLQESEMSLCSGPPCTWGIAEKPTFFKQLSGLWGCMVICMPVLRSGPNYQFCWRTSSHRVLRTEDAFRSKGRLGWHVDRVAPLPITGGKWIY